MCPGKVLVACALAAFARIAAADTLTVFAAASLKDALDENVEAYEVKASDRVAVSYAASSALAKQIEAGAPADLFISADLDWMDYLQQRRLIRPETRRNLLKNRLVLIVPADSTVSVTISPGFPLARLLGSGRLAMANPDTVPAGRYGKASLEALGVWKDVRSKIAAAENVRAALVLVSRGEAPFGIVYKTDAAVDPKVRVIGVFAENSHPPIIYPAALAVSAKPRAEALLRWLGESGAQAIFEKHGFSH
ncbi:MAG TPA: molybdate ABC transporter substrate-binding protein [Burkholderiales bacterium]|nr:molybdate ABC transporter substrate-binding protein [Burkholderiales bacterium]